METPHRFTTNFAPNVSENVPTVKTEEKKKKTKLIPDFKLFIKIHQNKNDKIFIDFPKSTTDTRRFIFNIYIYISKQLHPFFSKTKKNAKNDRVSGVTPFHEATAEPVRSKLLWTCYGVGFPIWSISGWVFPTEFHGNS